MRARPMSLREMVTPAAIAGGSAVLLAVLLSSLAAPGELSRRIAALAERTASLDHGFQSEKAPPLSDLRLVCLTSAERGAADLQTLVRGVAGQQGLTLADFRIDDAPPTAAGVQPVVFRFQATGSYEGAISILRGLAAYRTAVFVDQADLTSNSSSVTLNFTGRMMCAP